jgi:hypothetical protein
MMCRQVKGRRVRKDTDRQEAKKRMACQTGSDKKGEKKHSHTSKI